MTRRSARPAAEVQSDGPGIGTTACDGVQRSSCRESYPKAVAAAVAPLAAFGGRATREHHIRGRTQRSERLQFPTLRVPLNWKQTD